MLLSGDRCDIVASGRSVRLVVLEIQVARPVWCLFGEFPSLMEAEMTDLELDYHSRRTV